MGSPTDPDDGATAATGSREDPTAEPAEERIARLQRLTLAFAEVLTPKQVARAALDHGIEFLSAGGGALYVPTSDGSALEALELRGFSQQTVETLSRIPLDRKRAVVDAFVRNEIIYLSSQAERVARYGEHPTDPELRSAVVLPLWVKGRVLGVLSLTLNEDREFNADSRSYLGVLARLCGQALDRANLLDALERERQRLRAVIQQMPSALAIVDIAGRTVLANSQNEVIFRIASTASVTQGVKAYGDFVGFKPDGSRVKPEEWPVARSIAHGEIVRGEEVHIVRADGEHGFIRINSAPVRDEGGRIVAGVVTYDDITEQRRAEEGLRFLERASRELSASLDYNQTLRRVAELVVPELADWCSVSMLRDDGTVQQLAVTHVDPSKVELARSLNEKYPPDPAAPGSVHSVIREGKPVLVEEVTDEMILKAARDPEHLRIIRELGLKSGLTVPITTKRGTVGAISLVGAERGHRFTKKELPLYQELASRAALAIENATLFEEARSAIQKRDDFLSVASHELRTPLTSLDLSVSGLRRLAEKDAEILLASEKVQGRLAVVSRQSERLRQLVEDLLDVARISAGRLVLKRERVDLSDVVADVVDRYEETAARANCELSFRGQQGIVGDWDRSRVDQVATNLISNAVKYGVGRPVAVIVGIERQHAFIRVVDQGIGIAPKDHQRIFERFERAAVPGSFGGIGLGLWITREILDAHGGSIRVESDLGKGSTFTAWLPLELAGYDKH
ncbi:MAG: GAF domain-containing protein [Myxococcaceae bacterium]